jgi:hypothetical protein
VDEGDTFAFGADAGGFVDQANSERSAAGEGGVEVIDGEADMVESWTAFLEEPTDGAIGVAGFEELDEGIAGGDGTDCGAIGIVEWNLREP